MKWFPIIVMFGLCSLGCNADNGDWQGNDPTFDPAPDPDGKLTTPMENLPRPTGDQTPPLCGNEGQPCCVVAEFLDGCGGVLFCTNGICLPLPGDDGGVVTGGDDDGVTTGGDDGGITTGGDDGGVTGGGNDGGDGSGDDSCLDPDKGKGDDLHPHDQHRGRKHFCSKAAVVINAFSKD